MAIQDHISVLIKSHKAIDLCVILFPYAYGVVVRTSASHLGLNSLSGPVDGLGFRFFFESAVMPK